MDCSKVMRAVTGNKEFLKWSYETMVINHVISLISSFFINLSISISFWTLGLPEGVLSNRPCLSVRGPLVRPSVRL